MNRLPGWPGGRLLVAWLVLAAAALAALAAWQGQGYWEYSDGVYSLSARQLLDGQALYRDFAAAQPPPLYLLGAGALALSDTPAAIRVLMALCEAATSLLVLVAVWRLTRRPGVALGAALACLVTPWALREHAQLLPETVAAPLLMGAALAAGRRGGALAGGHPRRGRGVLQGRVRAAGAGDRARGARAPPRADGLRRRRRRRSRSPCLLVFGEPLWTNVVAGQAQTGRAALELRRRPVGAGGLERSRRCSLLAALAWPRRAALADADLARSLLAAALGSLLLLATLLKHGSWLTVMVVAEPPLLCLAACGVAAVLGERERATAPARAACVAAAAAAAVALLAAQAGSLLARARRPGRVHAAVRRAAPARGLSDARGAAGGRRDPPPLPGRHQILRPAVPRLRRRSRDRRPPARPVHDRERREPRALPPRGAEPTARICTPTARPAAPIAPAVGGDRLSTVILDCAHYQDGARQNEGPLAIDEAVERSREDGFIWLGLHDPDPAELTDVAKRFDLPALAVEDAMSAHQRPKLEDYEHGYFLVLHTARYRDDIEEVEFGEVHVFTGAGFVIVVRHGDASELHSARERLEASPELLREGPARRGLGDYGQDRRRLRAGHGRPGERRRGGRGRRLRRAQRRDEAHLLPASRARRVLPRGPPAPAAAGPARGGEADRRLARAGRAPARRQRPRQAHRGRDLDPARAADQRPAGQPRRDLRAAERRHQADLRWAAIITVPTLIASIYGMNFDHMPELHWTVGYPLALTTMVVAGLFLRRLLRRAGWL